jgi:hypothetical protein
MIYYKVKNGGWLTKKKGKGGNPPLRDGNLDVTIQNILQL